MLEADTASTRNPEPLLSKIAQSLRGMEPPTATRCSLSCIQKEGCHALGCTGKARVLSGPAVWDIPRKGSAASGSDKLALSADQGPEQRPLRHLHSTPPGSSGAADTEPREVSPCACCHLKCRQRRTQWPEGSPAMMHLPILCLLSAVQAGICRSGLQYMLFYAQHCSRRM